MKNSKQISLNRKSGKRFIRSNDNVLKQKEQLIIQMKLLLPQWKAIIKGKNLPLRIEFKFYRRTHQAFDYVNIVQLPLDCMVDAGLLHDDSMEYVLPSFAEYEKDSLNPRTIITVL